MITIACTECGKTRTCKPSDVKNKKTTLCAVCYGKYHASIVNGIDRTGENNPNWNGGSINKKNGYRIISGQYEHRTVMEEFLGRKLNTYEIVHHINGDKLDNRIENLELMTQTEHLQIMQLQKKVIELENRIKELESARKGGAGV